MSSQGKAYTKEQKEFIIRLKQSYDEERALQTMVSTCDPAGRVAKGLQVSLSTVKAVLAEYHRTGQVETPAILPRGKPGYRVGSALETVIRQRVRELNRRGEAVIPILLKFCYNYFILIMSNLESHESSINYFDYRHC